MLELISLLSKRPNYGINVPDMSPWKIQNGSRKNPPSSVAYPSPQPLERNFKLTSRGKEKKEEREKKIQQHPINLSTRRFNATIYILRERKRCHRRVVEKEKEEATNSGAEGRGLP